MTENESNIDNVLDNDEKLFQYVKQKKSRNYSLGLGCAIGGLFFGVGMWITLGLVTGIVTGKSLEFFVKCFGSGIFFGLVMYILFKVFTKRLMKFQKKDFLADDPQWLGEIIACIPSSHKQSKVAMGGKLLVGKNGLCFIPHRFLQAGAEVFECRWDNVKQIYKSTGSFSYSGLFDGSLRDRLGVETIEEDHFFVVNNLDEVISDLTKMKKAFILQE